MYITEGFLDFPCRNSTCVLSSLYVSLVIVIVIVVIVIVIVWPTAPALIQSMLQ